MFSNPLHSAAGKKEFSSILDRVKDDTNSIFKKTGREDKAVLDEYLTTLRETEQKLQNVKKNDLSKLNIDLTKYDVGEMNLDQRTDLLLEVMALALWSDSTRCISLMMGNSNSRHIFDFLGVKRDHHILSHFFRQFSKENV